VIVSRLVNIVLKEICASAPCITAIWTRRPSCARVGRADDIEDDVDAAPGGELAHAIDERLRAVVDRRRRAEALARAALLVAPGGREDLRPARDRKLNRRGADAARAAVHQQPLVRREPSAFEHIGPDREVRFRQSGRFGH
jgi:hypothetical protein